MRLPFLNRTDEVRRLRRAFASQEGRLCCLYGRRRCGKSRLLQQTLPVKRSVYYVCDEREAPVQRDALASAIAEIVPGFDQVRYPDWSSLLTRWRSEAPRGAVLLKDQ